MGWKAAISPLENVKYLKIALEDLMSVCVCVCDLLYKVIAGVNFYLF